MRRPLLTTLCVLASLIRGFAADAVKEKINILDLMKNGDVEYHINPGADFHDAPAEVFQLKDSQLHISGRGYGYMVTKKDYKDYHLVVEFKWGPKTWGKRADRARDNGILVHSYGPHGAYGDTWMASIEAQIIEGGIGDILVLSPKLKDGTELTTSVTAEFELDRDKEKIWKKGAPRQVVTKGRINWEKRDVDWADKLNFRGKDDPDSPVGEWNRMEVIAKGDTLQYFVNGRLVNEAFDAKPAEGRICIQTEGAEMIVRRYELHPLGKFTEKWNPIQASGGSDVSVRDGQAKAMTPEESQKQIQLDGNYEAQLVAAEPLVADPVEVTWDEQGRMYVADMRDYPLGPPNPGDPWLSRIQLLTDENGDGRMDKAVTFADHVDHVQGLLPHDGGLIATTRTEILFLKDTNGDGKADINRPLIKGFNPRHSQLQVSAPRWGLDNKVYFNNGLDAKEIYPAADAKTPVNVPRCNLRWDPASGKIEATTGNGQYGGAFDDYGRHFFCSNRNPLMYAVMPYEVVTRSPFAMISQGWEDIAPAGADTRVFPLKITHTTADAHAGTNTACCGLGVYRGHLMPELLNNVFVPDPTGQLVTRYKIEPNGASLKATRVGDRTEFFRSADEWCRPVNFTTGPDGAIYVCDIYRRWIDHARFFPEEFVKSHDMRQGENEGRIWRIVPKGMKAPKATLPAKTPAELAAQLNHPNAWQRETAQRLLVDHVSKDAGAVATALSQARPQGIGSAHWLGAVRAFERGHLAHFSQLKKSPAMITAIEALLKDEAVRLAACVRIWPGLVLPDAHLAGQAARAPSAAESFVIATQTSSVEKLSAALRAFPEDVWIQRAVLAAAGEESLYSDKDDADLGCRGPAAGRFLREFLSDARASGAYSPAKADLVRAYMSASAAQGDLDDYLTALTSLKIEPGKLTWWKPAFLQGMAEGLAKTASPATKGATLAKPVIANARFRPSVNVDEAATAAEIKSLLTLVDATISNPKAPLDQRLAALPLLGQRPWAQASPVLRELLRDTQPKEIVQAALAVLKKYGADRASPLIYELLPTAGPMIRRDLVTMLTSNAKTALDLFKRMEKGEYSPALVDIETRWRYQRGTGEMRDLAVKLFGQPSQDRAGVINTYMASTQMPGDAKRGQQVFASICITCHKHGTLGVDVGPPLSDVKAKPPEALLSDILDPNRMVEARWCAYQIDTKDGRVLSGLIAAESSDSVTLKMMGGISETIQRSNIAKMVSTDRSLMPPGLEAAITKEQMADLLAFLRGSP